MPEQGVETGQDLGMQFQEWEQKEERQEHSELAGTRESLGSQVMACELITVNCLDAFCGGFGQRAWTLANRKNEGLDNRRPFSTLVGSLVGE